jgi:hypothetical protein
MFFKGNSIIALIHKGGLSMKLAKGCVIGFMMVIMSVVNCFAATNWLFVYENDENGNRVSGSLSDLVSYVKSGADVKAVIYSSDPNLGYHSLIAGIVGVKSDSSVVYMQANYRRLEFDANYNIVLDQNNQSSDLIKTDGSRTVGNHQLQNNTTNKSTTYWKVKWYVNY